MFFRDFFIFIQKKSYVFTWEEKSVLLRLLIKVKKYQTILLLWNVFFPHFIILFSILNQFLLFMFRKIFILFTTILSLFFFFFLREIFRINLSRAHFWSLSLLFDNSSGRILQHFLYTWKKIIYLKKLNTAYNNQH